MLHLQEKSLELHETFPSKSSFSPNSPSLVATGVSHSLPRTHKSSFSPMRHGRKRLRRSTSVTDLTQVTNTTTSSVPSVQHTKSRHSNLFSQKSLQFDDPIASNHEIERIIAKIQQDNKILAELDKNAGESQFTLLSYLNYHHHHIVLYNFLFNFILGSSKYRTFFISQIHHFPILTT